MSDGILDPSFPPLDGAAGEIDTYRRASELIPRPKGAIEQRMHGLPAPSQRGQQQPITRNQQVRGMSDSEFSRLQNLVEDETSRRAAGIDEATAERYAEDSYETEVVESLPVEVGGATEGVNPALVEAWEAVGSR